MKKLKEYGLLTGALCCSFVCGVLFIVTIAEAFRWVDTIWHVMTFMSHAVLTVANGLAAVCAIKIFKDGEKNLRFPYVILIILTISIWLLGLAILLVRTIACSYVLF